ncbi:unnamed protein product, partial [Ectocarpus sp. 12 AP-2014]
CHPTNTTRHTRCTHNQTLAEVYENRRTTSTRNAQKNTTTATNPTLVSCSCTYPTYTSDASDPIRRPPAVMGCIASRYNRAFGVRVVLPCGLPGLECAIGTAFPIA